MVRLYFCFVGLLFSNCVLACEDFTGFYSFSGGNSLKMTQQACEYVLFEYEYEGKTESLKFNHINTIKNPSLNYAIFDGKFLTLSSKTDEHSSAAIVFSLDGERNVSAKTYIFDDQNNVVSGFEAKILRH